MITNARGEYSRSIVRCDLDGDNARARYMIDADPAYAIWPGNRPQRHLVLRASAATSANNLF